MDTADECQDTPFPSAPYAREGQGLRVLIGSAHPLLPELLRMALAPAHTVAGHAPDPLSLCAEAAKAQPDVLLIDLACQAFRDFEAARQSARIPETMRVLYLAHDSARPPPPASAPRAGTLAELVGMLDLIARAPCAAAEPARPVPVAGLSARQQEVLTLLVNGLPMKAVARRLSITPRTVAFHKYRTMEMLGLRDNAALVRYAMRNGLLAEERGS